MEEEAQREVVVVLAHREVSVRDIVQTALKARCIPVHVTERGEEALRLALETAARVVVLGLDLENVDGWQIVRALKASGREMSVVALTADARSETRQRASEAGFDGFITLPIVPGALVERLRPAEGWSKRS